MSRVSRRSRAANWLAQRLPFVWAPCWLNNQLARFMWSTPGFDDVPRRSDSRVLLPSAAVIERLAARLWEQTPSREPWPPAAKIHRDNYRDLAAAELRAAYAVDGLTFEAGA